MDEREPVSQDALQRHFHVTLVRGGRLWEMTIVGSTDAGEYRRAIAAAIRQRG